MSGRNSPRNAYRELPQGDAPTAARPYSTSPVRRPGERSAAGTARKTTDDDAIFSSSEHVDMQRLHQPEASGVATDGEDASSQGDPGEFLQMEVEEEKSTVMGATLNFTNSIIGAGIIGMPYAFQQAGFFLGVILLVALTAVVAWTCVLLIKAGKLSGMNSYQDLMNAQFGKTGRLMIAAFQFVFAFGGLCAYLVIIGDTVTTVLNAVIKPTTAIFLLSRWFIIVSATFLVCFPLSLQRDMASLAKTSAVSMISIILIVATVLVRTLQIPDNLKGDQSVRFQWLGPSPVKAISVMSFAFVCHHNTFIIYSSLNTPTLDRFSRVTHFSTGISLVSCFILAAAGQLTFTSTTSGNILNNFAPDDTLINVARLSFALNMFTTFPMELFVARHVFEDYFYPSAQPAPQARHVGVTLALTLASMIIALSVSDLSTVLEITGGLSATALAYIMPPWCWMRLATTQRYRCIACIVFGIAVMILSFSLVVL